MLRSATRWHEQGERNNKYFYRVIKDRQTTQTIQSLRNLQTGAVFHESQDIITEAQAFYRQLYTPESIDLEDMEHLLSSIPSEIKLSMDAASDLLEKPSRLDLLDLIARTPLGKSPGLDGLPFEVYRHLAPRSLAFCSLLLQIIHQAIDGAFPRSWFDTRMVLLYKKGDPELLTNWRPLSLINADAKLFTKLIANRINHVLPRLINPYQTGFMPHRLISDNGWLNQVLMANARQVRKSDPLVAVLLDQEKAYDRVHPEYLRCVLLRFGFPPTLVDSLSHLFFGTQIHVSINGWLGSPFTQGRGLRQGDPLSPLLFNLAFEPLLRSILASSLAGVSLASAPALRRGAPSPSMIRIQDSNGDEYFDHISRSYSEPGPIVKMLSYADDLEVFLTNPTEWNVLLEILECYGRASNAKVNLSKTVMVSLSGQSHQDWISIASQYGAEWHDRNSHTATRYLGYPLYHNQKQLHEFLNAIKIKIARHIQLLKGRSLSIRGSSMVANSLLLSRTWHVLRVVPAPAPWLAEIKKLVRSFALPFWPAPAWTTICLPRRFGGTSIIDIEDQALALHFVYIQRLCHPPRTTDFLSPWVVKYYQLLSGHASLLPWFMSPRSLMSPLKTDPNMSHLCKLLSRLPPLQLSPTWSHRWLLDLPLSFALSPTYRLPKLPSRYLLSDIVRWDPYRKCFFFQGRRLPPLLSQVQSIITGPNLQEMYELHLRDSIQLQIPLSYLSSPSRSLPTQESTTWLPSLLHWSTQVSTHKTCTVPSLSLTQLRRLWHPSWLQMLCRPRPPELPSPKSLIFPPSFWSRFWKMSLPHKAFTPWWRLLHGSLATRQRLYRWKTTLAESPVCALCEVAEEDDFHFFVGCPWKRPFWHDALQFFQMTHILPNESTQWFALLYFRTSFDSKPLPDAVLTRLGCIVAIIWRYHWQCIMEDHHWSHTAAFNLLTQDVLFSSLAPFNNTADM